MEDSLIETLSSFGFPVIRQGSLSKDDVYPDTFFTFWNVDTDDHSHYDNTEYGTVWEFLVAVYSTDPDVTYSKLMEARQALKNEGWIISGKGYDVASDEPTHTGRGMEVTFLEV